MKKPLAVSPAIWYTKATRKGEGEKGWHAVSHSETNPRGLEPRGFVLGFSALMMPVEPTANAVAGDARGDRR